MTEIAIRRRERAMPDTPPRVWPNGAGFYAHGGSGKPDRQYGWTFKRGGRYVAFRRTGPGEADAQFLGEFDDFCQALTKLGAGKLWPETYKAPTPSSRAPAPSPQAQHAPAVRVRQRVRPPLSE